MKGITLKTLHLHQVVKNLKGDAFKDPEGIELTLKTTLIAALLFQDTPPPSAEEKYKRFKLALKLEQGSDVELSVEEIAKIKDLVGKSYPAASMGAIWDLLEA